MLKFDYDIILLQDKTGNSAYSYATKLNLIDIVKIFGNFIFEIDQFIFDHNNRIRMNHFEFYDLYFDYKK
jgi:hypothetical protein